MANALTALRAALALPFFFWMSGRDPFSPWLAALALVLAILSDLSDGPIARRRGTASAGGQLFDHGADFAFVSAGLWALACQGILPVLLPIAVAIAFAQYVLDSYLLGATRALRMSVLGRWNGVLYFVPPVAHVLERTGLLSLLRLDFVSVLIPWIAWALVATTLLSIADRGLALRR